jgi:hypothetical protein
MNIDTILKHYWLVTIHILQSNSKMFEKVRFFIKQIKGLYTPSQQL